MPYFYEFTIQGLPKMTNRNNRGSWHLRFKEAKTWKAFVCERVLRNKPEKPLTRATLTLTRHSAKEPDYDGLVSGFKHVIDGLVEAGVLENDHNSVIGVPTYKWEPAFKTKGWITVRVEEK